VPRGKKKEKKEREAKPVSLSGKAVIGKSPDGVFVGFLSGGIPPY